jgi:hypothetical protein
MTKALKVVLIVYGAMAVVVGVLQVFFPYVLSAMMRIETLPDVCAPGLYALAMSGISLIAGGIFVIIAGTRDILRNILWAQFALLWSILAVAGSVYAVLKGYVGFGQVMGPIIINGVFFILLMVFYPWGRSED